MNVVEALDKLVRETKSNRTVEEIINLFDIPYDEVIDPYRHTFPRYRAIKGLLEGKKIFTTTWKSHHEYRFQDVLYTKIQKALKKKDVIFIIPSSEKNIFTEDAPALEAALHNAFETKKINKINARREFFAVSLEEIKAEVRRNFDKIVEWVDIPEAEQYRQSKLLTEV